MAGEPIYEGSKVEFFKDYPKILKVKNEENFT